MKAPQTAEKPTLNYEVSDASPRVIAITGAVLAAGVLFSIITAALVYMSHYKPRVGPGDALRQTSFANGPYEKTSIEVEWEKTATDFSSHLNEYAWVDRPKGVVRIPVKRAMELLVTEAGANAKPNEPTAPPPPAPAAPPASSEPAKSQATPPGGPKP